MTAYINKIKNKATFEKGRPQKKYQITVTDMETGEVMYHNQGYAGLCCIVEKITRMDDEFLEGEQQVLGWGHPFAQYYSLERLQEYIQNHRQVFIDILNEIKKKDL